MAFNAEVLWTAAWAGGKRRADPGDLIHCIVRSRCRIGWGSSRPAVSALREHGPQSRFALLRTMLSQGAEKGLGTTPRPPDGLRAGSSRRGPTAAPRCMRGP